MQGYGDIFGLLSDVKDACVDALAQLGTPLARAAVYPGAIAWDDCETCGLLAVAATRTFLSDDFPIESVVPTQGAANVLGIDVVVQVIRCAPTVHEDGSPPSVSELERTARLVHADALAVLCAVKELLSQYEDTDEILHFVVRQQAFVGPEGECVGSELAVAIGVML